MLSKSLGSRKEVRKRMRPPVSELTGQHARGTSVCMCVWCEFQWTVNNNLLLTEREGRIGEYWPEVVAVRTERSEVRTKTTEGQYSPVRSRATTSFPGSSLFLPRESTLVSAGHVSSLSKQLPTRVNSLFFKKRREKRMQIFSNWHEDRGMEVISSLFFKDRDAEKIYGLLSAAFQKHK